MIGSLFQVIGSSAFCGSGPGHHLLHWATPWFSYPDGMDHEKTQSLRPIASGTSGLECCGTLLRPQDDPAVFGPTDAELYFDASGRPRFYVMRIRRRPPVLKAMTRHHRVSQCLGSADAQPWWLALAPATDQGCPPPIASIALIKFQPGEAFKLHPGTWHAGPFVQGPSALFFNLELRTTNEDDHNCLSLEKALHLTLI